MEITGRSGSSTLTSPEVLQWGKVLQRDASMGCERDAQPSVGRERAWGHRDLNDTHVEAGCLPRARSLGGFPLHTQTTEATGLWSVSKNRFFKIIFLS